MQLRFSFGAAMDAIFGEGKAPAPKPALRIAHTDPRPELELARRRLQSELQMHLRTPVAIIWTTNRHSMVTTQRTRLGFHFRMHRIFAVAPPEVVDAIALLARGRSSPVLSQYIEANSEGIAANATQTRAEPRGQVYDLQRLFDRLNAEFFSGEVNSRITWGRAAALRRRSIKLGSYHASERLIRIHPALDQSFVPETFVTFVIFHEMLHEHLGTSEGTTRRCVHPPQFRALEARFPGAAEALKWEKENLYKLLKYKPQD